MARVNLGAIVMALSSVAMLSCDRYVGAEGKVYEGKTRSGRSEIMRAGDVALHSTKPVEGAEVAIWLGEEAWSHRPGRYAKTDAAGSFSVGFVTGPSWGGPILAVRREGFFPLEQKLKGDVPASDLAIVLVKDGTSSSD